MAALARMLAPTTAPNDRRLETLADQLEALLPTADPDDTPDDVHDRWTAEGQSVVREMLEIPAQGLSGLRAKALAATWCAGGPVAFAQEAEDATDLYTRTLHGITADLTALPSATVHPLPVVAPSADTVSEMMRAAAEFIALKADHAEAYARLLTTVAAAEALHPAPPAVIRDWQRPGHALSRSQLARNDANAVQLTWPKPTGSPRVEAFDHWSAQKAAIDSSFGIPGLEDVAESAAEAEYRAANRVAALAPTTLREAVVKYAVLLASWGDRKGDQIASAAVFFDFLADLERLASPNR
jgi:hypothetical protein